jgi:hypothetical protein
MWEPVLVRTGSGVQDVYDRPVSRFLSDHDVSAFGECARRHHSTITWQ